MNNNGICVPLIVLAIYDNLKCHNNKVIEVIFSLIKEMYIQIFGKKENHSNCTIN